MSATKERPAATDNGTGTDPLAAAIASEEAIRARAEEIWEKDEGGLNAELLRQLRPLYREPIPTGFIEHVGEVTGKPYESTGVKSVQVQMDRLDNVLGPENWGYESKHSDDGKRCYVKAWIGPKDEPLVVRDSWGGVNRGSTEGNVFKGSFTNAAKPALARLGPAWEVYVGAADFDPDTDRSAAKAQEKPQDAADAKLPAARADKLEEIVKAAGLEQDLPNKLRGFGAKALTDLTEAQAIKVYEWASDSVDAGEAPDGA